jgi:peroxiredoxin
VTRGAPAEAPHRGYAGRVARPVDFALPDQDGKPFRLSNALRERTVVVLFYRGDW